MLYLSYVLQILVLRPVLGCSYAAEPFKHGKEFWDVENAVLSTTVDDTSTRIYVEIINIIEDVPRLLVSATTLVLLSHSFYSREHKGPRYHYPVYSQLSPVRLVPLR